MIVQESDYYEEKSEHRYKIESKNSELKNEGDMGMIVL